MKKLAMRPYLLRYLVIIFFMLNVVEAGAQAHPLGGRLFGETIVDQFVDTSPGSAFHMVATGTGLYSRSYADAGLFFYSKVWTPPAGRTIKSIFFKRGTPASCPNLMANYWTLILLDNGDYYRLSTCDSQSSNTYISTSPSSQSWDKIKGDALYALSSFTIYVSYDLGVSWQATNTGLGGAHINDFDLDSSFSMIYAATTTGLYRKDTLPASVWSAVNSFTGTTNVFRVYLDRLNRILVGGNGSGLWISTDNGSSWTIDTTGLGANGTLTEFGDDAYGNLYGAVSGKLYRSINGNQPWERIDAGILAQTNNIPVYTVLAGDTILSVGTNLGNFVSANQGNTWTKADSGIVAQNYYGLAKLTTGKVFASTSLGIYKNNPGDSNWTKSYPQNGFSGQVQVFSDNTGVLYALDNNILHGNNKPIPIIKSTDQGLTWTVDTTGLSAINGNLFYIDETGTQHYANTLFGSSFINNIWKRTPPGAWTLDVDGFSPTNNSFNSAMVSDGNGYLYISGSFGGKKLMRRPIAGGTWVVDTVGIGSSVNRFTMMTKGHNGNVIGTNGFVLKQRTGGSWNTIPIPASLSSYTISAIAVDSSGKLFVAFVDNNNVGKGVYYVTNYEANWALVGLDGIWVTQMKAYNDTVYALSLGFGAYKLVAGVGPALPLKLLSFSAVNRLSTNLLTWKTENEYNTSHFEIERSSTGAGFNPIGSVSSSNLAGAQNDYMFIDQHPLKGDNYYRLKMIDKDSKTSYSKIERVYVKPGSSISVFPNPSNGQFIIRGLSQDLPGSFKVFDLAGKLIIDKKDLGINQVIDLGNQPAGNYVLKINQGIEELYFLLIRN